MLAPAGSALDSVVRPPTQVRGLRNSSGVLAAPPKLDRIMRECPAVVASGSTHGRESPLSIGALAKATGRTFTDAEKKEISDAQLKSYRHTFLGSGMTHHHFVKTLGEVSAKGTARVAEVAKALS